MRSNLPSEPRPEDVTAIVDSREQNSLDLSPLRTVTGTLTTGDYSVVGLEAIVAIERKSESDLLGCIGTDRARFEREVQRLMAYQVRALVIESTWAELEAGDWRSRVKPASVIGSLLGWSAMGLPIVMAGNHRKAGQYVSKLLYIAARRRWREARTLIGAAVSLDSKSQESVNE
jgi:DNA excision repair protein ERCC-4